MSACMTSAVELDCASVFLTLTGNNHAITGAIVMIQLLHHDTNLSSQGSLGQCPFHFVQLAGCFVSVGFCAEFIHLKSAGQVFNHLESSQLDQGLCMWVIWLNVGGDCFTLMWTYFREPHRSSLALAWWFRPRWVRRRLILQQASLSLNWGSEILGMPRADGTKQLAWRLLCFVHFRLSFPFSFFVLFVD